jgi:hypothetical protein
MLLEQDQDTDQSGSNALHVSRHVVQFHLHLKCLTAFPFRANYFLRWCIQLHVDEAHTECEQLHNHHKMKKPNPLYLYKNDPI